jgi:hypothetical protein
MASTTNTAQVGAQMQFESMSLMDFSPALKGRAARGCQPAAG